MKLQELKKYIDEMCEDGEGEKTVLITVVDRSIGARASTGIQGIFSGFDWESGQVRIEPMEPLCKHGRSKDDAREMNIYALHSSPTRKYCACPVCNERVKRDSNYCPYCGQHLVFNATKEMIEI